MKSYSGKRLAFNGKTKLFSAALMAGVLAMSPLSAELSTGKNGVSLQQNSAEAAGLADVALLENQNLRADYNSTTGILTLDLDGTVLLDLSVVNEQYYNFQLPEAFKEILALPNFQDAAQIEYEQRLLLGVIPVNSGTISGDDLVVDSTTGLVRGASFDVLNLSALSTMSAELTIDLNALAQDLPVSDSGELEFFGAATSEPLLDVFVLTDEGAQASLYNLENADLSVGTVTDQDTVVEGIKKRGSATQIRVFDGEDEIGRGTVDSDANSPYAVDIPQQQAGTVLTVQAYSSSGNPVGEALEVTVSDVTAPETPIVDGVTDQDMSVTGTGEAGTEVTVTKDDEVLGTGTVDGDGNFEVDIPAQPGGTELGVFLTDDAGLTSEVVVISVEDITAPEAPVVDDVDDSDTEVTGTGEPGAEVIVTTPGGTYTGTVDEDGDFSVDIPEQEEGTEITVELEDEDGNTSEEVVITVGDGTAPDAPEVDDVGDSDTEVTGTGEPGAEVVVETPDGTYTGTVDEDGNFSVDISEQEAGTEITVTLEDDDGNVSDETVVTVGDATAPDAPEVDDVGDSDTEVTGTGEPGAEVVVETPDGTYTGTVDEDGDFSVDIPEQEAGTEITVTLEDDDGNVSDETVVTVDDTTAPDAPSLKQVTNKSTSISGKAEAGSTVVIKNGSTEIARGKAGTDGRFKLDIEPQAAGTVLTAVAIDAAGNKSDRTKTTVVKVDSETTDRISGKDRFLTAIAISQEGWDSSDTVVLATSANFPDALAGGPLAFQEDAPILLTRTNSLKSETKEEIERLGASRVIILGSTGAISASVEAELEDMDLDIERIGGETRFDTAALIADELSSDEVVVANGLNFPDVLSISPYAAKNGVPILLTRTDRLPNETEQALDDYSSSLVIGETGVVSEDVYDELPDPTRYGGETRYETGAEIATKLMMGTDLAYIATGRDFPDALTGSVLAAKDDSPILLVRPNKIPNATNKLLSNYADFTIFGGTGAVSDEVKDALDEELDN
ncbi:hypothetical protein BBI11_12855 [Planococcus maritimus]|uniref:Ig-like domain-containing protein n=1 Tax=Planococcus maritimus TaxID=192421 RepID=UPI00080F1353|nr:Ig-like domain-containing protein [Planococcus maritimus]ANU17866.1 hypothetical protein BBI11_12855 [Planococcus maritimus]